MTKHRRKKWRLYQFLVAAGMVKSKHDAARLARTKSIAVNGSVMESLHYQVHPFKDDVRIAGKRVVLRENRRYFVLHKPKGIETTKRNVLRFLAGKVPPSDLHSFAPVGRLDKNSTGLLIITNDGRVGKKVLDPRTKRGKVYRVRVMGCLLQKERDALSHGVTIDVDGNPYTTLPAAVRIVQQSRDWSTLEITITEGKKRQVRNMCEAVGHSVLDLTRIAIAHLRLGTLREGELREYSKEALYRLLFE